MQQQRSCPHSLIRIFTVPFYTLKTFWIYYTPVSLIKLKFHDGEFLRQNMSSLQNNWEFAPKMATLNNWIFFSKSAWSIQLKLHMKHPLDKIFKVCRNNWKPEPKISTEIIIQRNLFIIRFMKAQFQYNTT